MLQFLAVILFTFSLSAIAAVDKPAITKGFHEIFSGLRCQSQVMNQLREWHSVDNWVKHISLEGNNGLILRSPTVQLGTWVGVEIAQNEATLELVRTMGLKRVSFNQNCAPKTEIVMSPVKEIKNKFTDVDLAKFIKENKRALIYTWSTQMPWSIDGIKEIKDAAAKLGVPVMVLMAPTSNPTKVQELISSGKITKEDAKSHHSLEFYMRGMTMHDPSVLWVNDGQLARWARPGHENSNLYITYFSKVFSL